jgi:hypothetical protein
MVWRDWATNQFDTRARTAENSQQCWPKVPKSSPARCIDCRLQRRKEFKTVTKRIHWGWVRLVGAVFVFLGFAMSVLAAQVPPKQGGAGPADPPPEYRNPPQEIKVPSVVRGRKAGIEVGQYAPDFQLQPIEPYAKLRDWLGNDPPGTASSATAPRLGGDGSSSRSGARLPRSASVGTGVDDTEPGGLFQKVRLSQLVGKAPILLLYGSYT